MEREKWSESLRNIFLEELENLLKDVSEVDRKIDKIFCDSIKKAKEGYVESGNNWASVFEREPELQEHMLSSAYAIELASLIPEVTSRALKIHSTSVRKEMDTVAEIYIEEATKCYIYGFYLAAAIMCRASIEYSLKKYLNLLDKEKDGKERFSIHYLIAEAINRGRFSGNKYKREILQINYSSSECVHGRAQIKSDECLLYINNTKRIVYRLLS